MDVLQLNTSTGRVQQVALTALPANALQTEVYNFGAAMIPRGSVVYINGSHGNLPTIALAKADAEPTSSKTYGVVVDDIGVNNNGFVIHSGAIGNLDTFALTEGTQLYLSPTVAGGYSLIKPSAPNHIVFVGVCTRVHPTFGTIEISIQNGYQLDELHDVDAILPPDKVILRYNSSTLIWSASTDFTTIETKVNANDGMGARIIPNSGTSMYIGANYESVVTRRMYVNGKLVLNGKVSVLF